MLYAYAGIVAAVLTWFAFATWYILHVTHPDHDDGELVGPATEELPVLPTQQIAPTAAPFDLGPGKPMSNPWHIDRKDLRDPNDPREQW